VWPDGRTDMTKLTTAFRDYVGKRLKRLRKWQVWRTTGTLRLSETNWPFVFCMYFLYKKNLNCLTCDSIGSNKVLIHIYTDTISTDLDTIFCDRLSNFLIRYLLNKPNLTVFDGRGWFTPYRVGIRGAAFGWGTALQNGRTRVRF